MQPGCHCALLLLALVSTEVVTQSGGGSPPPGVVHVQDVCGNLVADGAYFYQYDAFNRLVQVNQRGTLAFNAQGQVVSGAAGGWLAHSTYDGLGRLIRKQVPWNSERTAIRAEAYFYDGVRRIQEVFTDPKPGTVPSGITKGPAPPTPPPPPTYIDRTEREYIYTPGYVDEFICQVTRDNTPEYILQDANFDVVGLVNLGGGGGGGGAQVVSQRTYDPYGELLIGDELATHTDLRVGHQGLFFDRLDAYPSASGYATFAPGAPGLYQNRNRTYSPTLGRFIQRDPNASGLPLVELTAMHGRHGFQHVSDVDGPEMYGDGMSLYAYVANTPGVRHDPLGLDFSIISLMGVSSTVEELEQEWDQDVIDVGMTMRDAIEDRIAGAAFDQLIGASWAEDWSAPDDALTPSASGGGYGGGPDMAGSLRPGEAFPRWLRQGMGKASLHHIATAYGKYGRDFRALFKKAGMKLGDLANALPLFEHSGPHSAKYHNMVFERLKNAVGRKTGAAATRALIDALHELGEELRNDPSLLR